MIVGQRLNGKVAVVTGAGQGLGEAIAIRLAREGAAVMVNDLNKDTVARTAEQIRAAGGRAGVFAGNVTDETVVQELMAHAVAELGALDILVNNAGITRDKLLKDLTLADWDAVLTTNLTGAYLCTRAALRPMLRQRWGRILNISSVAGQLGNAGQANYAAAKAGLIGFTRATAREVASRQITVNAVAPGFVGTDLTANLPANLLEELNKRIPLERWGSVEDVAYAVAFLASDEASYITGQVLSVDGGLVMG